jgi:hypothetical protein
MFLNVICSVPRMRDEYRKRARNTKKRWKTTAVSFHVQATSLIVLLQCVPLLKENYDKPHQYIFQGVLVTEPAEITSLPASSGP